MKTQNFKTEVTKFLSTIHPGQSIALYYQRAGANPGWFYRIADQETEHFLGKNADIAFETAYNLLIAHEQLALPLVPQITQQPQANSALSMVLQKLDSIPSISEVKENCFLIPSVAVTQKLLCDIAGREAITSGSLRYRLNHYQPTTLCLLPYNPFYQSTFVEEPTWIISHCGTDSNAELALTIKRRGIDGAILLTIIESPSTDSMVPQITQQPQAKAAVAMQNDVIPVTHSEVKDDPHLLIKKRGADLGADQMRIQNRDWLTISQLSQLTGITDRNCRMALSNAFNHNKPWRKTHLHVRIVTNELGGGKNGQSYEVYAPSLPQTLSAKWYSQFAGVISPPIPTEITLGQVDIVGYQLDTPTKKHKQQLIADRVRPITVFPRHSNLRHQAVLNLMQELQVTKDTVYRWLNKYEKGGELALRRKKRTDRGKDRVDVTQRWDKAMSGLLTPDQRIQVGRCLTRYIRSLWRSGITGYVTCQHMATDWLLAYTQDQFQLDFTPEYLQKICDVSRKRVESEKPYSLIHIQETDKKQFHDDYEPTIQRHRDDLSPMDIVFCDVHPSDTPVRRLDGSIAYPRFIAWHDVATNRLWLTLKLCEKREAVTQVDVAQSYASMTNSWGIAKTLYFDNGSETQWDEMLAGMANLSQLIQHQTKVFIERPAVLRAAPYQAQTKPIEGMFSLLEQKYFAMLPGYVGGDRMRKKTQNIGQEPEPFPGTWEDFHGAIDTLLATYHATPQNGSLGGMSPNGMLQNFIDSGWGTWKVDEKALLLAFSQHDTRIIGAKRPGCVEFNSFFYYHDDLLGYTGMRLPIAFPRHDPRFLFIFPPKRKVICAQVDMAYAFWDSDNTGAKEKQRRRLALMRIISERKRHCDRLDLIQVAEDWNQRQPTAPSAPTIGHIEINNEIKQMVEALETTVNVPLAKPTSPPALSQWSDNKMGPLLENLEWAEED